MDIYPISRLFKFGISKQGDAIYYIGLLGQFEHYFILKQIVVATSPLVSSVRASKETVLFPYKNVMPKHEVHATVFCRD